MVVLSFVHSAISPSSFAADYYADVNMGDDDKTGTSPDAAWKTITWVLKRVVDTEDDLTSGPVLEGWIPDDRAHPSQGGHYDMPPGYDWDRIISQMNLFRSTYETMLGQRGSLSCVAEYAAKKWPDDAGELPTDDELMGYCAPIIPPPAP